MSHTSKQASRFISLLVAIALGLSSAVAPLTVAQSSAPSTRERRATQPTAATTAVEPRLPVRLSGAPRTIEELRAGLQEIMRRPEATAAQLSVKVSSLDTGRTIFEENAQKLLLPASVMKIFTVAAALDRLTPDFRFKTSVYADSQPDASGTVRGNLTIFGRGDPSFSATFNQGDYFKAIDELAANIAAAGVKRVEGDLVGDERYFVGPPYGFAWSWADLQWYYGAEVSALTINDNEATVTITPGKPVEAAAAKFEEDATGFLNLTNDAQTSARGSSLTIGVTRGLSDNNVRVWGEFPATGQSYRVRISVHQPALWAATLFREKLRARGINVEGKTLTRDARVSPQERFDTGQAVELAFVNSKSLGEIVRATNKYSINLNAELILRTLGRERGATAPDPDPVRMRIRGDDEAGTSVVRLWLEQKGANTGGLSLHDGSGLSRLDLVTPEATAQLLAAISRTSSAKIFHDSLPVAGRDGTLAGRLATSGGRLQAKTGTLSYNNSLSGYVMAADDEPLVFAIFCNDETVKGSSISVIDQIARLLTEYREAGP